VSDEEYSVEPASTDSGATFRVIEPFDFSR